MIGEVETRLQGRPDPIRVTTTIQDAASFEPPVKDGQVTIKELDAYVSLTVPQLTGKAQHPTSNTDKSGYKNFVVAELE